MTLKTKEVYKYLETNFYLVEQEPRRSPSHKGNMPAEMNFVVKQPKYIQIFINKIKISLYTEELNYRLKFYHKNYA